LNFYKCLECNNQGKNINFGIINKKCDKVICNIVKVAKDLYCETLNYIKKLISHPFKTAPISIPGFIFYTLLVVIEYRYFYFNSDLSNPFTLVCITAAVSTFGAIFIGLKYKLDQAKYHKDLFEKRYEIFITVDQILWKYQSIGKFEVGEFSGSLMRKSYFLFGEETYTFINKLREALIYANAGKQQNENDAQFLKKIQLAEQFLSSLIDAQKLSKFFPELKIDFY